MPQYEIRISVRERQTDDGRTAYSVQPGSLDLGELPEDAERRVFAVLAGFFTSEAARANGSAAVQNMIQSVMQRRNG